MASRKTDHEASQPLCAILAGRVEELRLPQEREWRGAAQALCQGDKGTKGEEGREGESLSVPIHFRKMHSLRKAEPFESLFNVPWPARAGNPTEREKGKKGKGKGREREGKGKGKVEGKQYGSCLGMGKR
jgi:hypothetical protein